MSDDEQTSVMMEVKLMRQEITYMRADVLEMRHAILGSDGQGGLSARVAVIEASEISEQRHFRMIWGAIVAALGSGLTALLHGYFNSGKG